MSAIRPLLPILALTILASTGCSSSTPTPSSPEPAPQQDPTPDAKAMERPATNTASPDADPNASKSQENAVAEAPPAEAEPAEEAPPAPPPPPSEILTAENVAFVLDWQASTVRDVLADKCEQKVGYEADAIEQCVERERTKFPADVLRFKQLGGQLRWTVYKRNKDRLQVVYSAPFTFVDETDYSVSLLIQGQGSGYRPLLSQQRTIPLRFPTIYTVEVDDPVWGLLVYNTKRGLVE